MHWAALPLTWATHTVKKRKSIIAINSLFVLCLESPMALVCSRSSKKQSFVLLLCLSGLWDEVERRAEAGQTLLNNNITLRFRANYARTDGTMDTKNAR